MLKPQAHEAAEHETGGKRMRSPHNTAGYWLTADRAGPLAKVELEFLASVS